MNTRASGDHRRELLFEMVRADPGLNIGRLAMLSGVSWNTCDYHLKRLAAEGRIVRREVDGRCRLYEARRTESTRDWETTAFLKDRRKTRIANAIISHAGRPQADIARAIRLPRSTLCRTLHGFDAHGLIRRVHDGSATRIYPTQKLRASLERTNVFEVA